ncbi:unnamed protein product [Amoebophrya sp. A120]|nr:unnamed protein product [Amoebophrya sp. A120]|eukprot:GSA120T00021117001.1
MLVFKLTQNQALLFLHSLLKIHDMLSWWSLEQLHGNFAKDLQQFLFFSGLLSTSMYYQFQAVFMAATTVAKARGAAVRRSCAGSLHIFPDYHAVPRSLFIEHCQRSLFFRAPIKTAAAASSVCNLQIVFINAGSASRSSSLFILLIYALTPIGKMYKNVACYTSSNFYLISARGAKAPSSREVSTFFTICLSFIYESGITSP